MNVAQGKQVLEQTVEAAIEATNGNVKHYTGYQGFSYFTWPGYLTIDLESEYDLLCIRFLLWDGLGKGGSTPAPRTYHYRLLTSTDLKTWSVIYETTSTGTIGWQVMKFETPLQARYVRIHGLHCSAQPTVHIVEIEAHTEDPPMLDRPANMSLELRQRNNVETQTDLLTTQNMGQLLGNLKHILNKNKDQIVMPAIEKAINDLEVQLDDVGRVEANIASVKRLIVEPVAEELRLGQRLGRYSVWGFWIGVAGFILALILFGLSIWLQPSKAAGKQDLTPKSYTTLI